ncbi:unnamed protein product [Psylliodes chrysocephalus]|uniref:Uncharacterized protein n=1 Tax=Psylliodes chrysocephalus TaxID=3402493 RepID=A0A9P0DBL1_9CUCU|nr:unnamed protein product [Psylliodes chrysocephala]
MRLHISTCLMAVLVSEMTQCLCANTANEQMKGKSRRKRYVAFPEGSTFIATLCDTIATTTGFAIYYEGINWGTGWSLPNRSSVIGYVTENKHKRKRKQRRDIYSKVETLLEAIGYNGPSCIYRALCEAPRRFKRKSTKLSEELLRIFFYFPLHTLSDDEPFDHRFYHEAHRIGRSVEQQDCADMYPTCTISLIDLALGYYDG